MKQFEIYWSDLTERAQAELLGIIGDIGNYDVIPLATIGFEEESFFAGDMDGIEKVVTFPQLQADLDDEGRLTEDRYEYWTDIIRKINWIDGYADFAGLMHIEASEKIRYYLEWELDLDDLKGGIEEVELMIHEKVLADK